MLSIASAILLFLAILSVLVLIHEWGHFAAARAFGITVEEFGFGFGPRLWGCVRRGTLYSINALPLGGFVRLKGEESGLVQDPDSFSSRSWWQKLIVIGSGVFMNIVLAVLLFTAGYAVGMPQLIDDQDGSKSVHVKNTTLQVTFVKEDSPAKRAGFKLGDVIMALNGSVPQSIEEIQAFTQQHIGTSISVEIRRSGDDLLLSVTPQLFEETGRGGIGIGIARIGIISYPIHESFILGLKATWNMTKLIVATLVNAFRQFAFDDFVGPVGIASYTSSVARLGIAYVIGIIAQLSISLAIFNVLPIPALDGGRAFFIILERLRGRALNSAIENAMHMLGFLVLIALMLLVTVRDIGRIFSP